MSRLSDGYQRSGAGGGGTSETWVSGFVDNAIAGVGGGVTEPWVSGFVDNAIAGVPGSTPYDDSWVSGFVDNAVTPKVTSGFVDNAIVYGQTTFTPSSVSVNPTPANQVASGIVTQLTYGESLVYGDSVYLKSDGSAWKADANGTATYPCIGLATETASSGTHGVLLHGVYRDDTRYTWTVGGVVYLSTTAGNLTQTAPSGADEIVQVCGVATHADRIYFRPDMTIVVHV